jgi:predicted metal-binding protein
MRRVAILTCSNVTQDLACASFQCLNSLNRKKDMFTQHSSGDIELAGIISCAGCPTAVAPEKLFKRVRSLAALKVDAIHLSTCMVHLCPFKNKYIKLLNIKFPDIEIIRGTHGPPAGMTVEQFTSAAQNMMRALLIQPQKTLGDMV